MVRSAINNKVAVKTLLDPALDFPKKLLHVHFFSTHYQPSI